jgi:hypothetical protein
VTVDYANGGWQKMRRFFQRRRTRRRRFREWGGLARFVAKFFDNIFN